MMENNVLIKDEIARLIQEAAGQAQARGQLPSVALPEIVVEHPQRPEHGDYATSLPLRLARAARQPPLDIARAIANCIPPTDAVGKVEVALPGFINFHLREDWLARQVDTILRLGTTYGNIDLGQGQRVQIEFVSANPVGPLHVGNGRGAVVGSTLANVLEAASYRVEREYYVEDVGSQVDTFAATLYARYQQLFGRAVEIPPEGYPGSYMVELAQWLKDEYGDAFLRPPEEPPPPELAEVGVAKMVQGIRDDLAALGVTYDVWFPKKALFAPNGRYQEALRILQEKGYTTQKEGATWFTSTALGEDKDNVLVRTSGVPTYFAADVAYHYDKFLMRGFQRVIDIWGADHQGHVPRMKAAVAALGIEPERLDIIVYQLVTLKRGGEVVRLSKRSGDIITLREVIDEVGADACRFFFLARSADAPMDFDLELAVRQSQENPVYYVQYAHARIASILAFARQRSQDYQDGDVTLLSHPAELALIRKMLLLPELVEMVARTLDAHHLPHYALDLATAFHDFYEKCRVVSDDQALSAARLKLVAAAKLVLARTLALMGMSAPERM